MCDSILSIPSNLSEQEEVVLNVILEYMDKNRFFDTKKILSYIHSKFKLMSVDINNTGIFKHLQSLIDKRMIVEGSKLIRNDILKNQKRNYIYEFVMKHPGSYFLKILEGTGFPNHVVTWHLKSLVEFGFLKKVTFDNHEIYFSSTISIKNAKLMYVIRKKRTKKIIQYLNENDHGVSKTELANALQMHINTVSKYIDLMEKFNLLTKILDKQKTLYFIEQQVSSSLSDFF
ncbi:MAG: HTH domain-containing protein [Candidatus Lokiarchaeota archaeon]|nr:HTH domain-containing protein [Candidatus Lokiarchaeota archaeon]